MVTIKRAKTIFLSCLMVGFAVIVMPSCRNKSYPCPGLGNSSEADLSMFDENGKLKDSKNKGRIDKSNGLVSKKNPKKLKAPRKTHL